MKSLLAVCLVALALGAGRVSAADRLSDTQMDRISAGTSGLGLVPSCTAGCVAATSSSSVATEINPLTLKLTTIANVINNVICGAGCTLSSSPTNESSTVANGANPGSASGIVAVGGSANMPNAVLTGQPQ